MERFLLLCRHSDKDENNRISAAGHKLITDAFPGMVLSATRTAGITDKRTIDMFFNGPLIRTTETMVSALIASQSYAAKIHSPYVDGLGSQEIFNEWMRKGFREAVKATGTNYLGAKKIFGDDFDRECQICIQSIEEMFEVLENLTFVSDNKLQFGAGFFHSPTVEMAASQFGWDCPEAEMGEEMPENLSLASLDGILFRQDDDGTITVIGVIRAKA